MSEEIAVKQFTPEAAAISASERWDWVESARAAARRAVASVPPEPREAMPDVPPADVSLAVEIALR